MNALMIHGAGGGAWEWAIWKNVFDAHGAAAHAIDLQPADQGLATTALNDYQRQVEEALSMLPGPRVAIGASLGGLLAAACGERADALVLVNPLPPAPWAHSLAPGDGPDVEPWGAQGRFDGTRRALADADVATRLFAHRRWRDESGRVLREAHAGIEVPEPTCPVLFVVSEVDDDVPPALNRAWAAAWQADVITAATPTHVGPLLGHCAARVAQDVVGWLQVRLSPR